MSLENRKMLRNILAISVGFFLARLLEIEGFRSIVQEVLVIGITGMLYWLLRKRFTLTMGVVITFLFYLAIRFVQYRVLEYVVI